jgi:spoIIIJ-associated protein
MDKIRDFYGKDVTTVMRDACLSFAVSQEELDIEVLETGSPGIFGLCKKKARIRVQLKKTSFSDLSADSIDESEVLEKKNDERSCHACKTDKIKGGKAKGEENKKAVSSSSAQPVDKEKPAVMDSSPEKKVVKSKEQSRGAERDKKSSCKKKQPSEEPIAPPSEELLAALQEDISHLFDLTGYPMQVTLNLEEATLHCRLSGEHEETLIGDDGRVLNSLQYLLRKMMSRRLPERMLFSLDVGDFRNRRLEELKEKAIEMVVEVKETGKTMMIPALSPAERREIHIVLKRDKEIRSRSVGDGLFKKILIYKPGKSDNPSSSRNKQKQRENRKNGQARED